MSGVRLMEFQTGDTPQADIIILTHKLKREFEMGTEVVRALQGIDLQIRRNEFTAIMGPSGSGKSTLLNLLGCLDRPTSGTFFLAGQDVSGLNEAALTQVRRHKIGFVFQSFHLVSRLTAAGNVEL